MIKIITIVFFSLLYIILMFFIFPLIFEFCKGMPAVFREMLKDGKDLFIETKNKWKNIIKGLIK